MPRDRFVLPYSRRQQAVLARVPKVTGLISILSAAFILQHVSRKPHRRVADRLLAGMSLMDILYSFKAFLSTWPIPAVTGIVGARGTVASCRWTALLGHGSALSSILYNGSLTLYYFWTIYAGWSQRRIQQHWETWLHSVPLVAGWTTAIVGYVWDLYAPIGWTCWIGPSPLFNDLDQERAGRYRWTLFHGLLWPCLGLVSLALALIYSKLRKQESRNQRYRQQWQSTSAAGSLSSDVWQRRSTSRVVSSLSSQFPEGSSQDGQDLQQPQQNRNTAVRSSRSHTMDMRGSSTEEFFRRTIRRQTLAKRFATQATLYVLGLALAWIFPILTFVVAGQINGHIYYPFILLTVFINPLQGLWNSLIYLRPRYLNYRKQQRRRQQEQQRQSLDNDHQLGRRPTPTKSGGSNEGSLASKATLWTMGLRQVVRVRDDDDVDYDDNAEELDEIGEDDS